MDENKIKFSDSTEENNFFKLFDEIIYNSGYQNIRNKVWSEKVTYWDSLKKQRPLLEKLLETKAKQLSNIDEKKAMLFYQFLISTKNYLPQILYENLIDKTITTETRRNLRDSLMAENIIWLANKYYPDKKIIIWAASYHLAKHKTLGYGNLKETLLGDYIRKELDKDTYTITFTAYKGNVGGYNGKCHNTISKPKESSLKNIDFKTGRQNYNLYIKTNT